MDYDEIEHLINASPALAILRKQSAPLAISFLYQEFKLRHRYAVSRAEILEHLGWQLSTLQEHGKLEARNTPEGFLDQWADEKLISVRISAELGDYLVQLSPDGERVIAWLEDMTRQSFIATESRLLSIYTLLDDVVNKSEQSVEERLAKLESQKAEIDAEITRIKETGEIEIYSPVRLLGRLQQIEELARQLLRDFAFIESRFRDLAQRIIEEQMLPEARKGKILGSILDAHEALRATEEGQSFYAFREYLANDDQRKTLQQYLEHVSTEGFIASQEENLFLRRLVKHLNEAGDRIDESNRRLSQNLRYLLDERTISENQRVSSLIGEIKQIAFQEAENIDPRRVFLEIQGSPEVKMVMERPLYEAPEEIIFNSQPLNAVLDWNQNTLQQMLSVFYIDQSALRENIESLLKEFQIISLGDLVRYFPIKQGAPELLSYIHIAIADKRHKVDDSQVERIELSYSENGEVFASEFTIPLILYRSSKDDG
jgi:hypothetical protein